jgi:L-amino acid N-acyltransferase YncA
MRSGRWVVAEEDGQVLGYAYDGPYRAPAGHRLRQLVAAVDGSHRQRVQ